MSVFVRIHYTRCWACQFGTHPTEIHAWVGIDDLHHEGMAPPVTKEDRRALAAARRCACWCSRPVTRPRASADRTRPKGSRVGSRRHRRIVRVS